MKQWRVLAGGLLLSTGRVLGVPGMPKPPGMQLTFVHRLDRGWRCYRIKMDAAGRGHETCRE